MTIYKTRIGVNEDGSPLYSVYSDHPSGILMQTGPITNETITTADGTTYEVSPDWIEVESLEHGHELNHKIGLLHEVNGHPKHDEDEPFFHTCTPETCGAFVTEEHSRHPRERRTTFRVARGLPVDDPLYPAPAQGGE